MVIDLISYEPFFRTLLKKNITEYHLIYKEGISANTLHRMKKGLPITGSEAANSGSVVKRWLSVNGLV